MFPEVTMITISAVERCAESGSPPPFTFKGKEPIWAIQSCATFPRQILRNAPQTEPAQWARLNVEDSEVRNREQNRFGFTWICCGFKNSLRFHVIELSLSLVTEIELLSTRHTKPAVATAKVPPVSRPLQGPSCLSEHCG